MRISGILILLLINFSFGEIFVDYSDDAGEGQLLFNFFHGIDDGYFVDVGAYDPYFHSNTVNLEALGWDGINVDAGPNRLVRFFFTKPFENNLNAAIGLQNQFAHLYDFNEDSSSTISTKVKDYNIGFNKIVRQLSVASLSLKQACERYYTRKPNFLNLDIEGFGFKALESNDWKNPKCVPEIIFSQKNIITEKSGFPLPETILFPNGYKRWVKGVAGINEAFIHQSVFDKYEKQYNQAQQMLKNIQVVRFDRDIQIAYKFKFNIWYHYEVNKDKLYYHISKGDEIIDLEIINEYSNVVTQTSQYNRPIILMNFNPKKSFLAIRKDYTYSLTGTPEMNNAFFNLTITKKNGISFIVLIFDHKYEIKPRILILEEQEQIQQPLPEIDQTKIKQMDSKTLFLINSSLVNSIDVIQKSKNNYEVTFGDIQDYKTANGVDELDQSSKALQEFQRDAIKIQIYNLVIVLVGLIGLNFWLCCLKQKTYEKTQNYAGVTRSQGFELEGSSNKDTQK